MGRRRQRFDGFGRLAHGSGNGRRSSTRKISFLPFFLSNSLYSCYVLVDPHGKTRSGQAEFGFVSDEIRNMDIPAKHNTTFARGARAQNEVKRDGKIRLPPNPLKFHKTAKSKISWSNNFNGLQVGSRSKSFRFAKFSFRLRNFYFAGSGDAASRPLD